MSDNERTVIFQLPSVLAGQIVCVEGTVAGRSWDLSAGTFVIGRRPGCDLYLPQEPGVSKTHAKIIADGEQYVLVDEESRNGTIINGRAVRRQPLLDGDTIQICGCKLRFSQATGMSEKTAVSPGMSTSVPGRGPVEAPLDFPPPHEDTHVDPDTSVDAPIAALEPDLMPLHPPSEPPMPPVTPPGPGELVDFTPPGMDIPGPPATPPPTDAWTPQDTELSRPQVAAPGTQAVRRGSTTPSFFVGLFVALFIGGGAYAGMLFVGEGSVPGAMADGEGPAADDGAADPSADPATDPAVATDPATADATQPADAETDPAAATDPAGTEQPAAATADATATDPAAAGDPAQPGAETAMAEDNSEPAADPAPPDDEADDTAADEPDDKAAATPPKARKTKARRTSRRRAAAASTDDTADDDEDEAPTASAPSTTVVPVNVSAGRAKKATVSAKSSGTVNTVAVKVGDEVAAGETLVVLTASDGAEDLGRLEESVRALEEVVRSSGSEEAKQALEIERRKLSEAKKSGGKGGPVTAPIAGKVTALAVKAGQSVSSGKTVATIESSGKAMVYATVGAKQAQKLKVGATVKLKTKAGDISAKVVSKSKTRSGRYTVNIDPGATDAYDVQGLKL